MYAKKISDIEPLQGVYASLMGRSWRASGARGHHERPQGVPNLLIGGGKPLV